MMLISCDLSAFERRDHSIKIYVPSTVEESKPAPELQRVYVDIVTRELCSMFGGCTNVNGVGNWMNENGDLVSESVIICGANCLEDELNNNLTAVIQLAKRVQVEMSQYCVSVEIDGSLIFVR